MTSSVYESHSHLLPPSRSGSAPTSSATAAVAGAYKSAVLYLDKLERRVLDKLPLHKLLLGVVGGLGSLVLLSYAILLPRTLPSGSVDELWFGIDGHVRTVYYVSIVLSALAFLGAFYWIYTVTRGQSRSTAAHTSAVAMVHSSRCDILFAYMLLLTGAISWTMSLWWWGNYQTTIWRVPAVWSVLYALCKTSVGALWVWYIMWKQHAPFWVSVCAAYFVAHVLVLDNIGWFGAFYRQITMQKK